MEQHEIIARCPCLLGDPFRARGGRPAQVCELKWLRENLLPGDDLLIRAEWKFGPKRRGIPWSVFKVNYLKDGPPGYAYPGLGVG